MAPAKWDIAARPFTPIETGENRLTRVNTPIETDAWTEKVTQLTLFKPQRSQLGHASSAPKNDES